MLCKIQERLPSVLVPRFPTNQRKHPLWVLSAFGGDIQRESNAVEKRSGGAFWNGDRSILRSITFTAWIVCFAKCKSDSPRVHQKIPSQRDGIFYPSRRLGISSREACISPTKADLRLPLLYLITRTRVFRIPLRLDDIPQQVADDIHGYAVIIVL